MYCTEGASIYSRVDEKKANWLHLPSWGSIAFYSTKLEQLLEMNNKMTWFLYNTGGPEENSSRKNKC